jgi:tetratricopeptide (TPR) repeat protein
VACTFESYAPFGKGQEGVYAVVWNCPSGHGKSLDVCPVGPLVPARELCLNCGSRYASEEADAQCGSCGLKRTACLASLGVADAPADPVAAARTAFAQGLFRHGLAVLNYAIQEGTPPLDAWFLKSRFLSALRFNRSAAEMLDGALARATSAADRVRLYEEQSFLWAECERGKEALRSADAAAALGSESIRTHYLRGRALALLGRLREARDEMEHVLTLDPQNADAQRALGMIVGVIGSGRKSWWQVWKQ